MKLAKAIYSNEASAADELSFRIGDVLTVLEEDPQGLEGWWLCTLRGRTGIAPGNRLKQIQDVFEGARLNGRQNTTDQCSSGDAVITPRKLGETFVYDTPVPRDMNKNIFESIQDYDQPFVSYQASTHGSEKQQLSLEKLNLEHIRAIESLYDAPGALKLPPLVTFPESNRSSSVSMSSVLSSISGNHSSSGSAPPSGRSSYDVTHDVYDIPPSALSGTTPRSYTVKKSKSSDFLDSLETYDSPSKSSNIRDFLHSEPLYQTPKSTAVAAVVDDGGEYCEIHDSAKAAVPRQDSAIPPRVSGCKSPNKNASYHDSSEYDTPLSNPPKCATGETTTINNEPVPNLADKELRLNASAAVDLVNKHRSDLEKSCQRLYDLDRKGWRKRQALEPRLFDVKVSCIAVKTALGEFTEFALGALANSTGLADKQVYYSLKGHFDQLSAAHVKVNKHMKALDEIRWDISRLSMETLDSSAVDDDLNQLVQMCRALPDFGRNLGEFILAHISLLFELYHLPQTNTQTKATQFVTPIAALDQESLKNVSIQAAKPVENNPTVKPKPPFLKPKPKLDSLLSTDSSETIPSVVPKPNDQLKVVAKPHDFKSTQEPSSKVSQLNTNSGDGEDYDVPREASLFSTQRVTPTKLDSFDDGNKDYDNAAPHVRLNQLQGYDSDAREATDYDYAALSPEMHTKSIQYKYDHEGRAVSHDTVERRAKPSPTPGGETSGVHTPGSVTADYDSPVPRVLDSRTKRDTPFVVKSPVGEEHNTSVSRCMDIYDSPKRSASNLSLSSVQSNSSTRPASSEFDVSAQMNHLNAPAVRTSGLSPKFQEKLQQLQSDAEVQRDSQVSVSSDLNARASGEVTTPRTSVHAPYVISDSDRQVLAFYAAQLDGLIKVLGNALDAFYQAVDENQPPKTFVSLSKFVILAAHKLVYVGDTISRNVSAERVRGDVMSWSNQLCDALKATVTATKHAALQYPSVSALQEMVNRTVNVSQITNNLKHAITRNL